MNNILICCVIFNQSILETNTYKTLLKGRQNVFIYDNSPSPQVDVNSLPKSWKYISDSLNPGLSFAYNTAAQYARDNGFDWLMIADQDTQFAPDIIKKYEDALLSHKDIRLFCPVVQLNNGKNLSPVRLFHYVPYHLNTTLLGIIDSKNIGIINSGILINVNAFFKVGGYNESVFLDYSDFQFVERFSTYFSKVMIVDCVCHQSFSNIDDNLNQKVARYKLFCKSLKGYKPKNYLNKFWITFTVLKRAISICYACKDLNPILIFIKNYIL